jgi:hypothetical protein
VLATSGAGPSSTVLEGGGLIVELLQLDDARSLARAAPGSPLVHGIFKAGVVVADSDKAVATLRERHVEFASESVCGKRDAARQRHHQGQRRQPDPDLFEQVAACAKMSLSRSPFDPRSLAALRDLP